MVKPIDGRNSSLDTMATELFLKVRQGGGEGGVWEKGRLRETGEWRRGEGETNAARMSAGSATSVSREVSG